jgi:hypothetical protein
MCAGVRKVGKKCSEFQRGALFLKTRVFTLKSAKTGANLAF